MMIFQVDISVMSKHMRKSHPELEYACLGKSKQQLIVEPPILTSPHGLLSADRKNFRPMTDQFQTS